MSLKFEGGEVHALVGKNGAGKSTLVKILAGAVIPTKGKILINDKEVKLASPRDAHDKGIVTVHQELSLAPMLSVGENILLGRLPCKRGRVDWKELYLKAEAVLKKMNVDLDARQKVSELGVAQQQIVEIAKAMAFEPKALLLDEPTSALAHHETETLFSLIRDLANHGVIVIYITHRLQELKEIADKISVLRDGKLSGEMREHDSRALFKMMFGDVVQKKRPKDLKASSIERLRVSGLCRKGAYQDISFSLFEGEVLGIAGMLGSGRTELLKGIFGAEPFFQGKLVLGNHAVTKPTPEKMKGLRIAFTPENRKEEGLVQVLSIRANICLAAMKRIASLGFIQRKNETVVAKRFFDELQIKAGNVEHAVSSLSGGNQQKVVVGNWLATDPQVILFDEPTRGVDVNAKQQIFQVMWDLSRKNVSSIFVSSDLEELIETCHRILVMRKGRVVEQVLPQEITVDELFVRCMGE